MTIYLIFTITQDTLFDYKYTIYTTISSTHSFGRPTLSVDFKPAQCPYLNSQHTIFTFLTRGQGPLQEWQHFTHLQVKCLSYLIRVVIGHLCSITLKHLISVISEYSEGLLGCHTLMSVLLYTVSFICLVTCLHWCSIKGKHGFCKNWVLNWMYSSLSFLSPTFSTKMCHGYWPFEPRPKNKNWERTVYYTQIY